MRMSIRPLALVHPLVVGLVILALAGGNHRTPKARGLNANPSCPLFLVEFELKPCFRDVSCSAMLVSKPLCEDGCRDDDVAPQPRKSDGIHREFSKTTKTRGEASRTGVRSVF